jgi:hypothetical protein
MKLLPGLLTLPVLLVFVGCGHDSTGSPTATSAKTAPMDSSTLARRASSPPRTRKQLQAALKIGSRETLLSTYNNPDYGISFQYPKTFALDEAILEQEPLAETQQLIQAEQPGVLLLGTITIPDDAYPNTTFEHASLQVVVNPLATPETCRQLVSSQGPGFRTLTPLTAAGASFARAERISEETDSRLFARNYAGFSNGTCYEFFLRVSVGQATQEEGAAKQADGLKVLRRLEKIISSLQISPRSSVASSEQQGGH